MIATTSSFLDLTYSVSSTGGVFLRLDGRVHYDENFRKLVVKELKAGHGKRYLASKFSVSQDTARNWVRTYKAAGAEGVFNMGNRNRKYSYATKVAAVRDHIENGVSTADVMVIYSIASSASLGRWYRLYREGGAEALKSKREQQREARSAAQGNRSESRKPGGAVARQTGTQNKPQNVRPKKALLAQNS
ncbi:MAG: helix-turn-helix domain-containing protein [Bifidobacteriaceae bacterium]|nr:helix-turn-helix domain-containing protein [Bifidobacteriaceae bacterium]MCI1915449.1 helix-turn-helix domain-containing protein [Bifidobacteriaceae bacterium]